MIGGVAVIAGGVLLLVESLRSQAEQGPLPSPPPPHGDAWLRTPTWHEDPMGKVFPAASGVSVTFRGTF